MGMTTLAPRIQAQLPAVLPGSASPGPSCWGCSPAGRPAAPGPSPCRSSARCWAPADPAVRREASIAASPSGVSGCGRNGPTPIMSRSSLAKPLDVVGQALVGLARDADHHAAADLVAELCQPAEDGDPVRRLARQRRMDPLVQLRVGGFEPQQVAIGPGLAPGGQLLVVRSPRLSVTASGVSALIRRTRSAIHSPSMPGSSPDCSTTVP